MMNIRQVYQKYLTPPNLQEHMLRVAALAELILNHWQGTKVDKKAVIQACLFHDIGKPMTFSSKGRSAFGRDLDKQAQFGMSEREIANLKKLQKKLADKYGQDEHQATVGICREIGLSPAAVKIVDNLEWKYIPRLLRDSNLESLIPIYSDMRIGPKGILPLKVRLAELKARTNNQAYKSNLKNGQIMEKAIKQNADLDLNLITNNQLNSCFKKLLNHSFH